jgi:hypothetical protein
VQAQMLNPSSTIAYDGNNYDFNSPLQHNNSFPSMHLPSTNRSSVNPISYVGTVSDI